MGLVRTIIVAFVFAVAMVGLQRATGLSFWPALGIYFLGNTMAHVARLVE